MRYVRIFPVLCFFMLLCACNSGEKEHRRLSEEMRAINEENSYLKAQIIGLKKQWDALSTKVKAERERLQTKFEEDHKILEMKFEKQTEALLKKTHGASKKDSADKKKAHQKETHVSEKEPNESALKVGQGHTKDSQAQQRKDTLRNENRPPVIPTGTREI